MKTCTAADKNIDGTVLIGATNGNASLTKSEAMAIRFSSLSQGRLAEMFNISQPQVHNIQSGKQWSHLAREVA